MSLETEKAALVQAVDALTDAIVGKSNDFKEQLDGHEQALQEAVETRNIDGATEYQGAIRRAIFQGFTAGVEHAARYRSGDFPEPPALGSNDNVYVHFKTPLNVNRDSHMFWFHMTGYSFGSSKIIDETLVGYCYAVQQALISSNGFGNLSPTVYVDPNGNVVLRLLFPSIYYTTIHIDTMQVGDGPLFQHGDLEVQYSYSATVTFAGIA